MDVRSHGTTMISDPTHQLAVAHLTEIRASPQPGRLRQAVAVLPFVNLTNDPDYEYLDDGITDEILGTPDRSSGGMVGGGRLCVAGGQLARELLRARGELGDCPYLANVGRHGIHHGAQHLGR